MSIMRTPSYPPSHHPIGSEWEETSLELVQTVIMVCTLADLYHPWNDGGIPTVQLAANWTHPPRWSPVADRSGLLTPLRHRS